MKEPYLNTSPKAYLHSDQNGLCWRMFKESSLFPAEEPASLDRLPAWGTICAGELLEHRIPEVLTGVRDGSVLLPTVVVNDMGRGKTIEEWEALLAKWKAKHNNNGHGKSLSIELEKLKLLK